LLPEAGPGLFAAAVHTGNILMLYGTGEGSTNPQLVWGNLNISTPYSTPTEPATATVNGRIARSLRAAPVPSAMDGICALETFE
jgi:uncharacterized protein (TIGR03437 family)